MQAGTPHWGTGPGPGHFMDFPLFMIWGAERARYCFYKQILGLASASLGGPELPIAFQLSGESHSKATPHFCCIAGLPKTHV